MILEESGNRSPVRCFDSSDLDWEALAVVASRFARRWCRSYEDHDAVSQEALLRLLEHVDSVRTPVGWLFVTTRRIAFHWRQENRAFAGDATLDSRCSSCEAPEDLCTALRTVAGNRKLSLRKRQILIWTAMGHTHLEIARRLGAGRSSIGQEVARARADLLAD
jgi:DNA-directed RNA polymerase specialized sigma24 family protein